MPTPDKKVFMKYHLYAQLENIAESIKCVQGSLKN